MKFLILYRTDQGCSEQCKQNSVKNKNKQRKLVIKNNLFRIYPTSRKF